MYSSPRIALRPRQIARGAVRFALLAAIVGPCFGQRIEISEPLAEALEDGQLTSVDELRLLQEQVRRIVTAMRPLTVAVELDDSVGSGVIVSADGLVLTAGHVGVEPNRRVRIRFPDNTTVRGLTLGINHRLDSGLVRITSDPPNDAETWPYAPLAETDAAPGEWVVGLGQPNGFVEGRAPPVRLGRVLVAQRDAVNTDVTLVGGDSGGPLFNLHGEVVGIHSKIGQRLTSNYHVPAGVYRRGWDKLLAGSMTGVPDGQDPDDWRPLLGLAVGESGGVIVVTQVFPNEAAADAGVRIGDQLMQLGDKEVTGLRQLNRAVRGLSAYDRTPLVVKREGTLVELEVWLGRAPKRFPGAELPEENRR